jgi:E3 ubiquitin-protein ligase BRE1
MFSVQLKTQLEENRAVLQHSKNAHMRQIEQMESEELLAQKKLRTEVIQLEDMLAQVPKEQFRGSGSVGIVCFWASRIRIH